MAAVIGGVLFAMVLTTNEPSALVSGMIFALLKSIVFLYCLFAGVRFTADALSGERREGTLGLLFLTPLRGYDVVLGKLATTSLNAFFCLLAAIPLLGVPVIMGGVSGAEFWRITLVLINTLVLSLSVGLVVSAFGAQERNVLVATLAWILLLGFGLPLCWWSISRIVNPRWLECILLFPSPAYALRMTGSGLFTGVPSDFWPCMLTMASLSLSCVVTASVWLPRSFQEENSGAAQPQQPLRRRSDDPVRARLCRSLNPYLWRVSRDPNMLYWGALLAVIIALSGFIAAIVFSHRRLTGPGPMFGWLGVHWLLKLLFTVEACRPFSEDKRSGSLELLLCTPVHSRDLTSAQGRRLRVVFAAPVAAACAVGLLLASVLDERVLSTLFFWGVFGLLADCLALRWTGIQYALTCSSLTRAVFSSLWRVMVPPWIAFFMMILILAGSQSTESTLVSFLVLWTLATVVYDISLALQKKALLTVCFRRMAAGDTLTRAVRPAGQPLPRPTQESPAFS